MIQLNKPFTDVHGITHNAAVLLVQYVNFNNNKHQSANVKISPAGEVSYDAVANTNYQQVRYGAYLYSSLEALQQGKQPMQLKAENQQVEFVISNLELATTPTTDELIALCEQHLITEVVNVNE